MGRLRDRLIAQYAEHYARINLNVDVGDMSPKMLEDMRLTYGEFVATLPEGSRVLDLGCGVGFLLYWLSMQRGIVPIGVDSSATQVAVAKRNMPNVDVFCEDGLSYLQKNPNTASGIFCIDVLEHIPGDDLCLEWIDAAWGALEQDGFFFCRAPNAASLIGTHSRYLDLTHERIFASTSIIQLLEAGGFKDCRVVPTRSAHMSGRLRLKMEAVLHRATFRICGRAWEDVFTKHICAVGFKR